MVKKTLIIVVLLVGGVGLSACGATSSVAKFVGISTVAELKTLLATQGIH